MNNKTFTFLAATLILMTLAACNKPSTTPNSTFSSQTTPEYTRHRA